MGVYEGIKDMTENEFKLEYQKKTKEYNDHIKDIAWVFIAEHNKIHKGDIVKTYSEEFLILEVGIDFIIINEIAVPVYKAIDGFENEGTIIGSDIQGGWMKS